MHERINMPADDKTRQQSSYMPSSGGQQGSGQTAVASNEASNTQERRDVATRQGTWLGARDYGGSPFSLMRRLSEDMDRLFENFFPRGTWASSRPSGGIDRWSAQWSPHIELYEKEGRLCVEAELPGLRKEDVNAQIEEDHIIISGERKQETQRNEGGAYWSERSYGSFYRAIPLPEGADAENANATFRDGVLRIEMPFKERQRGRKLTISEAGESGSSTETASRQRSGSSQAGGGTSSSQAGGTA
jgi:HSP20 family protein